MKPERGVTVVGAGIAGAACARALRSAGVPVRVLERGRAPGGRLASPLLHDRRVDLGAGYFTVRDPGFAGVVQEWAVRGLARPWTDSFGVLTGSQLADLQGPELSAGPIRWATPNGLRSLVRDLLSGIEVLTERSVTEPPAGTLVLAMPDPQASRLCTVPDPVPCTATIAIGCGYPKREWPGIDGWFVNDHPVLSFVADDGTRRGDGAPVLVAHTTAALAERCLDRPDDAIEPVLAALTELLGVGRPDWTHAHRWRWAKPASQHRSTFGWGTLPDGRRVGLAGDQWCPDGAPRVESAWRSGTDLGTALATGQTS